jgi:hypothetical protein
VTRPDGVVGNQIMNPLQLDDEAIFHVARKIEAPEARAAYLEQVCGDDRRLWAEVEVLLSAYDCERSFLESPPIDPDGTATEACSLSTEGRAPSSAPTSSWNGSERGAWARSTWPSRLPQSGARSL